MDAAACIEKHVHEVHTRPDQDIVRLLHLLLRNRYQSPCHALHKWGTRR